MRDYKNIQEEVEKTLNSLDTYTKRKAKPFMYTRIQAKLEDQNSNKAWSWFFDTPILKPALASLIIIINAFTIWQIGFTNTNNELTNPDDSIALFAEEYAINQASESYYNLYDE